MNLEIRKAEKGQAPFEIQFPGGIRIWRPGVKMVVGGEMIEVEQVVEVDDKQAGNGFGDVAFLDGVVQQVFIRRQLACCRFHSGDGFGRRWRRRIGERIKNHHRRDDDESHHRDFPFPFARLIHARHHRRGGGRIIVISRKGRSPSPRL